ncbi:MAG: serine/threonine protein kinase [Coleofasciculaceae cyanobacterium]
MLGKLLDQRYQVIEPLGIGGFGQTYKASDTRRPGNPICVVKHLKPASSDPNYLQTARRLFNSEAETLERLGSYDQIPRLLAYFEENQEFYLVQQFIVGHLLNTELHPGQHWTENQVVDLLKDVLQILAFVHSYGVIHRDLKPDNLIRRNSDGKLVLIDFGAVKQVRTVTATPDLINATVAVGTPGYMSREQILGRPQPSSDIYSLGIIAIQALTGLHPTQLQEDAKTRELSWQQQVQVSPELAAILNKMVRYDYRERYQSANEALNALALSNSSVAPTILPQTPRLPINQKALPAPPARDKVASDKFPWILGTMMVLVVGVGFAIAYWQSSTKSPIANQNLDTEITPTQTPTNLTPSPENTPTPKVTTTPNSSTNEFDKVDFPQANCGDSLPTNSEGTIQFYPVFIDFSDNNLQQVKANFCGDAYRTTREDTKQLAVQVASFTSRDKAQLFRDFMERKLGSGEVGQPTIIEPDSSPTPSPTSSPATPSPTPSPTNLLPNNCTLIVNDPQSPLNVRSLPDLKSDAVGTLNNGTPVTFVAEKDGWIQISSPIPGWIAKNRTRRVCN